MVKSIDENDDIAQVTIRKRRRALVALSLFGIGCPLAWLVWSIFGWPTDIVVSPETTWLTEPVGDDGYVDYMSYVSERHAELGGGTYADDTWHKLHEAERGIGMFAGSGEEYISPAKAFRSGLAEEVSAGERELQTRRFMQDVIPRLTRELWTADDHPMLAANIVSNEDWFAKIRATFTPTSSLSLPGPGRRAVDCCVSHIVLPATEDNREFSDRFLLRAAHRFGSKSVSLALSDAAFVYDIAARDRFFMIELLVGASIESKASRTLIVGLLSSAELTELQVEQIESLPHGPVRSRLLVSAEFERIMTLDLLCRMHKSRATSDMIFSFSQRADMTRYLLERRFCRSVDWNAVLRHQNEFMDEVTVCFKQQSWRDGYDQIEELFAQRPMAVAAESKIVKAELWQPEPRTDDVKLAMLQFHQFILEAYRSIADMELRRRVVQVVARLNVWRGRHGEYPTTLDELRHLSPFSEANDDILLDPYSESRLIYTRNEDGFELRSVGANGTQDSLGFLELEDRHQDPIKQPTNDDCVWLWPVSLNGDGESR